MNSQLDTLHELGEVLTKYPALMDYLKVSATSDKEMELLKLLDSAQ